MKGRRLLLGDLNEWRLGNRSALKTLHTTFGHRRRRCRPFPSGLPLLALDRIMANRHGMVSSVEAHDTPLSRVASDHLPLTAFVQPVRAPHPSRSQTSISPGSRLSQAK